MKKKLGFSLVELLVTLVLLLLVGALIFPVLIKGMKILSTLGGEITVKVRTTVDTSILAFDIIHAGYGISNNETSLVLSYCNGTYDSNNPACNITYNNLLPNGTHATYNKLLLIKTTLNQLNKNTTAFFVFNNNLEVYNNSDVNPAENYCVWLDKNRFYEKTDKCNNPPNSDFNIAFVLDEKSSCLDNSTPFCCKIQNCTGIAWYIRTPHHSLPSRCLEGTGVLYRYVRYKNNTNPKYLEVPVIDCVADWDVWFAINTTSGIVFVNSLPNSETNTTTNADLLTKLKAVKVYLLVQASFTPDPTYNYSRFHKVNSDDTLNVTLPNEQIFKLKLPANFEHYRWEVFEFTVFPKDFPQ
jgi:competence protein ComGC